MMTSHSTIISSISQRRRWFGAALLAGVLTGSIPGRAGADCVTGESLSMTGPVVTVIAGPGDVAAEQELWSSFDVGFLGGDFQVSFGETFNYEAAP